MKISNESVVNAVETIEATCKRELKRKVLKIALIRKVYEEMENVEVDSFGTFYKINSFKQYAKFRDIAAALHMKPTLPPSITQAMVNPFEPDDHTTEWASINYDFSKDNMLVCELMVIVAINEVPHEFKSGDNCGFKKVEHKYTSTEFVCDRS